MRKNQNSFAPRLLGRKNRRVLLHATVHKVDMSGSKASGVTFMHEGKLHREIARDVILCGGAINTPQLLLLSGIGDPGHLRQMGIAALHDLPGVGGNLRDHPLVRMSYKTRVRTNSLTGGLLNKSYPSSHGRVRLASNSPTDSPLIECRLLQDESDLDTLVDGIELVRNIMNREPMARIIEQEILPGPEVSIPVEIRSFLRARAGIAFHPVGTCRMSNGDDAVVDARLKVRGVDNLWIADASIFPDLISGNTNAACMMIGIKLGRQLAEHRAG